MSAKKRKTVSRAKAKLILREGMVHGKKLTAAQKRLFGLIAGGGTPTRLKKRPKPKRRTKRAKTKAKRRRSR